MDGTARRQPLELSRPLLRHGARLGIAWIWQLRRQHGCVPKDADRSLARIDVAELMRLAVLAADAEFFERNPRGSGRYAGRQLGRALCQGAALHYVNGKNGVKHFDVESERTRADPPIGGCRCWQVLSALRRQNRVFGAARPPWRTGTRVLICPANSRALGRRREAASPPCEGAQGQDCAMCGMLPPGVAGSAGQRITPGLGVHFGEPDLAQGLDGGGIEHRGLLGCAAELCSENAAKAR
jgi:hypothetical protein